MEPQQLSQDELELAYIKAQADILRSQQNKAVLAQKDEPFSIAGVPVVPTAINAVLSGAGAAAGGAAGLASPVPGGTVLGAGAGAAAGNYAAQKLNQALGYEEGNPANPMDFKGGQMAGAAILGPLGASGQVAKGALPFTGRILGDAAMSQAAGDAQTLIDQHRLMNMDERKMALAGGLAGTLIGRVGAESNTALVGKEAERAAHFAYRDENLAKIQQAGFKAPSLLYNDEKFIPSMVEGTAGKADLRRELIRHNQFTADNLAKQDMGLPVGDALRPESFQQAMQRPLAVYKEIDSIHPDIAKARVASQKAREAAQDSWKDFESPTATNRTTLREKAVADAAKADAAESDLFAKLKAVGRDDLYEPFVQARKKIAQIKTYENAFKPDGTISIPDIGSKFDATSPFTDNLEKIALANKLIPKYTGEVAEQIAQGGGKLAGSEGAVVGAALGGVPGWIAGKVVGPATGGKLNDIARRMALSDFYQKNYVLPQYAPPPPTGFINFAQKAAMMAGRPNDYLAPFLPAGQ